MKNIVPMAEIGYSKLLPREHILMEVSSKYSRVTFSSFLLYRVLPIRINHAPNSGESLLIYLLEFA